MKPKIKRMNWLVRTITFGFAAAICLAPIGVFLRKEQWDWRYWSKSSYKRLIRHETTHWKQQMEMFILPFYICYFVEWILKLPFYGRRAYRAISFEREAKWNEDNRDYLKNRKRYSWVKYLWV